MGIQIGAQKYGNLLIPTDHVYPTTILERAIPEESAKKQKNRRKKPNIDEQEELNKMLLEHFLPSEITQINSPFPLLQIKTRRSKMVSFIKQTREEQLWRWIEEALPAEKIQSIKERWDTAKQKTTLMKKIAKEDPGIRDDMASLRIKYRRDYAKESFSLVNKIIMGRNTAQIRQEYSHPWSYYEIDRRLQEILEIKERIDENFRKLKGQKTRKLPHEISEQIQAIQEKLEKLGGLARTGKDGEDKVLDVILPDLSFFKFIRYLNSDEFINMNWCMTDIEKPRFDTPKEEVSWVATTYCRNRAVRKKEIHTSKDTGAEFTEKFHEKKQCKIHLHASENELMKGVNNSINAEMAETECGAEESPNWALTSYNTPYDWIEMRDTEEGLYLGKRRAAPKKESTTKFFERLKIRGMIIFDPLNWAKIARRWLPNRKLAMIAQELGHEFEKKISYKVMAELEDVIDGKKLAQCTEKTRKVVENHTRKTIPQLLRERNPAEIKQTCARIIAYYVYDDTNILPKIIFHPELMEFYQDLDEICRFANIDIQTASHTPNAINNQQERLFFEKVGTYYEAVYPITTDRLKRENQIRAWINRLKHRSLDEIPKQKGIFENVAHLIIPTWPFLKEEVIASYPDAQKFFEYVAKHRNNSRRFNTLSQYADALCKPYVIAWGTYIRARDAFDRILEKEGIDFYKLQDFAMAMYSLIEKTYEKHRLCDAYITQEIIKNCLDCGQYQKEYARQAETDFGSKKANEDCIKKINETMQAYKWDLHEVQYYLNEWLKLKNKRAQVLKPFASDPDLVEITNWEIRFEIINRVLKEHNVTPVYKRDYHLYVQGTPENLQTVLEKIPLIHVDTVPQAYITSHPNEGIKIYYPKHGFYNGIKIQDEPSNVLTQFEMDTYGQFLTLIFAGQLSQANEHMEHRLQEIQERFSTIPKQDLLRRIKSKKRYNAFIVGRDGQHREIEFCEKTSQRTSYDKQLGLPYIVEYRNKKEPEKVYITGIDNPNLALDRERYQEKIVKEIEHMRGPVKVILGLKPDPDGRGTENYDDTEEIDDED